MKLASVQAIADALNAAGVRYLVVGGVAVVAHGYLRYTKDVDLVIQLTPDNIKRAMTALSGLGYRPIVPVDAEAFADAGTRQRWIQEKNMTVLQLWSDAHRETPIDIFVAEPFDFEREERSALHKLLSGSIDVPVVALATLIAMKEAADRPEDRLDVHHLRMIQQAHDRS